MTSPAQTATEYVPAVFVPLAHPDTREEIVDSVKGEPWHLAAHNADLYPKVKAGTVFPVTREAFEAKGQSPKLVTE